MYQYGTSIFCIIENIRLFTLPLNITDVIIIKSKFARSDVELVTPGLLTSQTVRGVVKCNNSTCRAKCDLEMEMSQR